MHAQLVGFGSYLPQHLVSNKELFNHISNFETQQAAHSLSKKGNHPETLREEELFDLWVQQVCGITARPFLTAADTFPTSKLAPDLTVENMALAASINALADAGMEKEALDHVLFSTYSGNRVMPSPVCGLIEGLGLKNVSGRTLNGACSGFLDALIDAVIKIEAGYYKNILVVAAEHMSNKMDYADPKSSIIFSDGAGACIVSGGAKTALSFASAISYSEQINLQRGGNIYFKGGPLVERNAVKAMFEIGAAALEKAKKTFLETDLVVPHQANSRIVKALEEKIYRFIRRAPETQKPLVVNSISHLGNLSSATIPVTLDLLRRGKLYPGKYQRNQLALLSSVGGGYTYAAVTARV